MLKLKVKINVLELRSPGLSAAIAAQTFVSEIERRLPFRRVMKQGIERIMKAGAQGVKIAMAGRLNGAEIARTEKLSSGKIPLITLRSDMDYAFEEAHTTYGKIGVKVWIYKGEVFGRKDKFAESGEDAEKKQSGRRRKVNEEE